MKPVGSQLGQVVFLVVVMAVFLPPAITAVEALVAPLLIVGCIAFALRLLWY